MVPLRIYGDDANHTSTSGHGFLAMTYTSCASFRDMSLLSRLHFIVLDLKLSDIGTFEKVYTVLAWSMLCLSQGVYPFEDHEGRTWTSLGDERRASLAGSRIAGDWTAVPYEATGDWKYLCQAFQLPWRYNMRRICWLCKAEIDGDLDFKDVSPDAIHTLPEQERTHEDYCRAVGAPLPMLAAVFPPRRSIVIDWQHAVCLGIAPRACGSALLTLALEGKWGQVDARWKDRIDVLMRRAYRDFLDYADKEGLAHS